MRDVRSGLAPHVKVHVEDPRSPFADPRVSKSSGGPGRRHADNFEKLTTVQHASGFLPHRVFPTRRRGKDTPIVTSIRNRRDLALSNAVVSAIVVGDVARTARYFVL